MQKNGIIYCNKCGKKIREEKLLTVEEFHVEKTWGYFSDKDGQIDKFDICEECYDQWLRSFLIPAEREEAVLLF